LTEHDPALDQAGRFGEFLDRSIEELKPTADRLPTPVLASTAPRAPRAAAGPSKFSELADKIARTRRALDERADRLIERVENLGRKGEETFDRHEDALNEHERGIESMEEALSGLMGHNGAPIDE